MSKAKSNERDSRAMQPGAKGPSAPGTGAATAVAEQKGQPAATPAAAKAQKAAPAVTPPPARVSELFRGIDWLTMALTFAVVFVVYCLTIAPELTLEDSGELVTGSFYAGIPHPPGYPVWTIYSWLWTVLVPWGNMAWRVALAEAFLGALACGLLSLMVSRGSSLLMESIEELKNMTGKWENAICIICGFVAGLLMGLDGFMWKESVAVNRIAVSSVPWFLIVLLCILRWLYAPHQYRFLYAALFVFGVCFTTHQSLITAAIGIEIAIAAGNPKLGRDVFFGNFLIYMLCNLYLGVTGNQVFANLGKAGLQVIFHSVGIGSLVASIWLALQTKTKGIEIGRNLVILGALTFLELFVLKRDESGAGGFYALCAVGALAFFVYLAYRTWLFSREWLHVLIMGGLWVVGFSFYFYMAVSGMSNPPMQWGYPRTVEGWFHALTRGQYEQPSPTDVITDPGRFLGQIWILAQGVADEYTWAYMFVAAIPFLFFLKLQKRERAWLIGLTSIYLCLGVLLVVLLNPTPDRASVDLVKVFFCNSHTIIAALIGYGLALTAAFMATHYQRFRYWGLLGGGVIALLALCCLWGETGTHYFGRAGWPSISESIGQWPHWIAVAFRHNQFGLPIFGNLVLVIIPLAFIAALLVYRDRAPLFITLGLFLAMPLYSGLAHLKSSDQRNHWFGYWFGHDMFTPPFKDATGKPIYPEMTKDAVLYGGTDPGRFCPTYMIFCESFTPHNCQPEEDQKFDRRDVYIITQNALADGTYLNYIRAHYNRSKQIDPPFFQDFLRSGKEREQNYDTNVLARAISPLDTVFEGLGEHIEKKRRTYTSWFTEKDFLDLPAFAARLRTNPQPDPLAKFIYDQLTPQTQQLLAGNGNDAALREGLAKDLNVLLERELEAKKQLARKKQEKYTVDDKISMGNSSESLRRRQEQLAKDIAELSKIGPLYEADRFKQVQISEYLQDFIKENPQSHTRIRLNRLLLEAAYPKEIARTLGGVYPDREIYIASPDDSQRCFSEYYSDAKKRLDHDMQFPDQPKQIKPGEDIKIADGRLTVAGQTAVMSINGLLTKVMFDANPKNEFFVEESFPLDWMYPHLTPYGVIMKINRQPLPALPDEVYQKDHLFWKQYSKRLTGDFIDYDTPIKQICDWIEKTYLRRDFNGFTGDRKFIYDDDGQKSFSKLRSSIGGIYAWRLTQAPPEYRPKSNNEYQQLLKEADFTFKQAFAFCPYSPEAVFRYANLLMQVGRLDDALLIAETCLKLDPFNGSVQRLLSDLQSFKEQQGRMTQARNAAQALEDEVHAHPTNFQAALELAQGYLQAQQPARAASLLDTVLKAPGVPPSFVARLAQLYYSMNDWPKLEASLEKLTQVSPESPEAWYDLASCRAKLGKTNETLAALGHALDLSVKRHTADPTKPDLVAEAAKNDMFAQFRQLPEYQKLFTPK